MENRRRLCRPGGLEMTDRLLRLSGLASAVGLTVVDVGCGEGATVEYLRRLYPSWTVMGIDPDPAVYEKGMIETGRAEALPVSDGSQDLVLMECSLSKTEEPERALAEAFRVLKPEGCLLISDMYAKNRELSLDSMLGRLEFSRRIWAQLRDAGFSVLEMQDQSEVLAQWMGQQIMEGNGDQLSRLLGADRRTLREVGCGYFLCAARPSKLWPLLSYVKDCSPFYGKLLEKTGSGNIAPGDWEAFRRIPFTTSEDLRKCPEQFLCVPAKEIARIITLRTSGSTGNPKRLFFTEGDLLRTADFFEKGMQYLVNPGDRVMVYMEGPGLFSIGGLLKEGLGRIGVETAVHGLIRDVKAAAAEGEGCDCFVGTPGQMYALAVYAPHLKPRTVLLSADYVPRSVKRFLESTWHCRVFTHWGMTETGYGGGVQCGAREGYHMRDEDILLEIIDPDTGQPVTDGAYGELVLTTLTRRGMPLIRYRTGDLGRFIMEPCGCGCLKPRLAEVEERLDDVICLPGGTMLSMHVLDELLLSDGMIRDFRVCYDRERCCISVTVMEGNGVEKETAVKAAKERLEQWFGAELEVQVECRDVDVYIGSGKRRIV